MFEVHSTIRRVFLGRRSIASRGDDRAGERGSYIFMFALMLPLLFGVSGLAVDLAHYRYAKSELQNAADSAAFAAAQSLNSTETGRTNATNVAGTYASAYEVDGMAVAPSEVIAKETGRWSSSTSMFTTSNVSGAAANAVRVSVRRNAVQSYFSPILSGTLESRPLQASATAVAGGAGAAACATPIAIASCVLSHDSSGNLICPTNLSFQNGAQSVGLTHPDGSSPVNGNNTVPYFKDAVQNPLTCNRPSLVGTDIPLQNGNDLNQTSVNDINAATGNGANPIPIIIPVVDKSCGGGGPTYNQSATIVGFIKMRMVGARWTGAAPAAVAAACPTLGKKNICVTNDCSPITGAPGGGTAQVDGSKVYLVR